MLVEAKIAVPRGRQGLSAWRESRIERNDAVFFPGENGLKKPQLRHAAIKGGSVFPRTALFFFVGAREIMKQRGYKAFGRGTFIPRHFQ